MAATFLLPVPAVSAQRATYLRAIEVFIDGVSDEGQSGANTPRRFTNLSPGRIILNLELGESIEGQVVVLRPRPGSSAVFMVEQRVETSLTVMAEGPHLDLRDWKHYYSPWRRLASVGESGFRINSVSEAESAMFPEVNSAEIRAAVRKAGGASWARMVRNVKGPHDYPSAVSVSKITLRVSVREGSRWRVIHTLDFLVPMGC
jgi:hypothetical protein